MSGTKTTRRDVFLPNLIAAAALLGASSVALAQTCGGKLPTPQANTAPGGEKFRLILQQCPALAEPATVQQASQLDLYEKGSVTINMSEPVEEKPAPRFVPPPATPQPAIDLNNNRDVSRVLKIVPAITAAAQAYDLDPLLLHAIAHIESRHGATAVSPAGARGVMQMMPATARRFGVNDGQQLFDATTNLRASAAYLRTLFMRYGENVHLVLAAYNAGEGAVDRNGRNIPPYPETQAYVRDVLAVYRRLQATFSVSANGTLVSRNEQGAK
jgi:soluble lytic murein transglycosylase-like protein